MFDQLTGVIVYLAGSIYIQQSSNVQIPSTVAPGTVEGFSITTNVGDWTPSELIWTGMRARSNSMRRLLDWQG
jgi:hypothetical protein